MLYPLQYSNGMLRNDNEWVKTEKCIVYAAEGANPKGMVWYRRV